MQTPAVDNHFPVSKKKLHIFKANAIAERGQNSVFAQHSETEVVGFLRAEMKGS